MSTFYGSERSNGFRVKDPGRFKTWARSVGLSPVITEDPARNQFVLYPAGTSNDGYFPSFLWNEDTDEQYELDMVAELSRHLLEGEVAILVRAGFDRGKYVSGSAQAITWDGRTRILSLNDIYSIAVGELGADPTRLTRADYEGIDSVETPSVGGDRDAIKG